MNQPGLASEPAPGFAERGLLAFTTTRQAGSFNLGSRESAGEIVGRWDGVLDALAPAVSRLACARQLHGDLVLVHDGSPWHGWLRAGEGDGHFSREPGTALAVTLADCVPVFIADRSGGAAVLHSGWKGTEARIIERGIALFQAQGADPSDLLIHLGPAICGRCYVVGPEVFARLTGRGTEEPAPVDLRSIMASHASAMGVREISISPWCTRCHNHRFFSHRAGDEGRQLGVIAIPRDG